MSNLPALVNTPALEIDSTDVVLPRLYVANQLSSAVKLKAAFAGDIYVAYGKDDEDPQVLWTYGKSTAEEGVVFHVLGMTKGLSAKVGGKLESFPFGSDEAPADASVTYNYLIALPTVEKDIPYKFLLSRSGSSVARKINTVLKRAEGQVPAYAFAFRLTTKERTSPEHTWNVAVVEAIEADPEHIKIAEALSAGVAASTPAPQRALTTTTDAPEI